MKKEYLECGRICAPHGVRGIIKVESWCDSPKVLSAQKRVYLAERGGKYKELAVTSASASDRFVLFGIDGITSREDAQGYKNKILYLHRSQIPVPKGAVLIADMIGLSVIDFNSGRVYGILTEVEDGPQGKLYTVRTEDEKDVLLPAVPEFVKEIDTERGVFITPIPGFFD